MQIVIAAALATLLIQPATPVATPPATQRPAALAARESEPAAPSASVQRTPAVSDAELQSVKGRRVVVEAGDASLTGTLKAIGPESLILATDDGELVELGRPAVTGVWPASLPWADPVSTTAPPPTASTRACTNDASCRSNGVCEDGKCRTNTTRTDPLRDDGNRHRRQGLTTLLAGAPLALIGTITVGLGVGFARQNDQTDLQTFDDFEEQERKSQQLGSVTAAGAGLLAAGGILMIAGGIAMGVGNRELKSARRRKSSRGSVSPVVGLRQVGLRGRF